MRVRPIHALLLCSFIFPGAALANSERSESAKRAAVEQAMAGAVNREAIDAFAGRAGDRCFPSATGHELCQWSLGNRDAGWRSLARAIQTRDRIVLLCELPTSGDARAAQSCSAHPRRSNRDEFSVPSRGGFGGRPATPASEIQKVRDRNQRQVARWIGEARTLVAMSRLMGALPDRCTPTRGSYQDCRWRASSRTYGQGTLATWIEVSPRKRIRFDCTFPLSGAGREDDCRAELGS
jgi:hypothetical protein